MAISLKLIFDALAGLQDPSQKAPAIHSKHGPYERQNHKHPLLQPQKPILGAIKPGTSRVGTCGIGGGEYDDIPPNPPCIIGEAIGIAGAGVYDGVILNGAVIAIGGGEYELIMGAGGAYELITGAGDVNELITGAGDEPYAIGCACIGIDCTTGGGVYEGNC